MHVPIICFHRALLLHVFVAVYLENIYNMERCTFLMIRHVIADFWCLAAILDVLRMFEHFLF